MGVWLEEKVSYPNIARSGWIIVEPDFSIYHMKVIEEFKSNSTDYERIEEAIRFLEVNFRDQPALDDIARSINLSKYHFHRLFKRWAGVTPSQFLQYLTISYSKKLLRESHSIFETSLDAGLSSGSRLHDLFISFDAVSPGEYKKHGEGLRITFGFHSTPFGECILAATSRGICALRFITPDEKETSLSRLVTEWPNAEFVEQPSVTVQYIKKAFSPRTNNPAFHLALKGTNFQVQVWRALVSIPAGSVTSYQDVARFLGMPNAARAVAASIAKNPVAYLIPCHRVIRKSGEICNYRWGTPRKRALIGWEASGLPPVP